MLWDPGEDIDRTGFLRDPAEDIDRTGFLRNPGEVNVNTAEEMENRTVMPGTLYLCATPIGNLGDMRKWT